jgi:5-amino-6-(5-phosphoribosylamino)uracil reductase
MEFKRLFPTPGHATLPDALDELELAAKAPAGRPYTIVNFVTSIDGRATFQGRSGQLGDDGDRAMFLGLRQQVDAVLAGTTTIAVERYGALVRDPEARRRRVARGLQPEPIACIVTRSGKVPTDAPLFAEPGSQIIVFTPEPLETSHCAARVEVVRVDPGELTLTTALRHLRADHGVRTLLCEGGPTVFGALLGEALVDELFVTLVPKLVGGGSGPTISSGPELPELARPAPIWVLERAGSLYLRYGLVPS